MFIWKKIRLLFKPKPVKRQTRNRTVKVIAAEAQAAFDLNEALRLRAAGRTPIGIAIECKCNLATVTAAFAAHDAAKQQAADIQAAERRVKEAQRKSAEESAERERQRQERQAAVIVSAVPQETVIPPAPAPIPTDIDWMEEERTDLPVRDGARIQFLIPREQAESIRRGLDAMALTLRRIDNDKIREKHYRVMQSHIKPIRPERAQPPVIHIRD